MDDTSERQILGLTIRIQRDVCIATTNCIKLAGDVFELDDEHICAFRDGQPLATREQLIEACRVCPVDALIVIDENGEQLVP